MDPPPVPPQGSTGARSTAQVRLHHNLRGCDLPLELRIGIFPEVRYVSDDRRDLVCLVRPFLLHASAFPRGSRPREGRRGRKRLRTREKGVRGREIRRGSSREIYVVSALSSIPSEILIEKSMMFISLQISRILTGLIVF